VLAAVFTPATVSSQQRLTLSDAIVMAHAQSHQARAALATRDAARLRDRSYNASLLPQVALSGNVPVYNRSIIPVVQPDGSTFFRSQQQTDMSLSMNVTQQVPLTGAELFASSSLARVDIAGARDVRNWSSTPVQVGIRQSLMRPNNLSWTLQERHLQADVAERQYTEAREDIAIATASAFFDYYSATVALGNATTNVAINDSLFTLNKGRYEVGRIGENDLLQSELVLLNARTTLDGAQLEHDRTLAALTLQLNLPPGSPIEIVAPVDIPGIAADTGLAVAQALANRAQVLELELQNVQARRRASDARLNSGFGATVQASMGFNQTGPGVDAVYRDLLEAQRFSVAVQMPLVRWGGRSADIQAARLDLERSDVLARRSAAQLRNEAHFAVLELQQAARQLTNAAKADTVGAKRFEVAHDRYLIGRIGLNDLFVAQSEKDRALAQYVQSLRGYWLAYYRLRRAALYDFGVGRVIR